MIQFRLITEYILEKIFGVPIHDYPAKIENNISDHNYLLPLTRVIFQLSEGVTNLPHAMNTANYRH